MNRKTTIAVLMVIGAAACLGLSAQEQETQPAAPVTLSLIIEEGVVCTGVVDRVPQGAAETFTPDVGKLYCFTKVSGASGGTTIKHLWYRGETLLHTQELSIGGSPWRTWSNKTVTPDMTGTWKVDIQDADGNIITTLNFTVQ